MLATQQILLYGLGGYTRVELDDAKFNITIADPLGFIPVIASPANLTVNLPDSLQGYTVGGGLEARLSESLSFKFEYRYTDLDAESASVTNSVVQCCVVIIVPFARLIEEQATANLDLDIHSIRASLAWRPNFLN